MKKQVISGTILLSMVAYSMPALAYTKDETVYSKIDKNGEAYKTIVSTYLQNSERENELNDLSDLINIQNTNGDETFATDGNTIVWNSNGEDIYYQGETEKELPVSYEMKYELDGEEILVEDLIGKSGKVKITISYTNKEERVVNVNGKSVKMYVPFVVIAGTIIDNSQNRNIEVSNGKIINDGSKTVVAGIALPGMQESLGISKSEVEIPNTIEISMETENFEQETVITYVTPKVFEDEDLSIFDKLDELYSKVDTIQSAYKQIVSGANELKEGTEAYSEKSEEFNNAMNQVSDGISTVNTNYAQIDNGISTVSDATSKVETGAVALNEGVKELTSSLSTLPEGIETLYQGSQSLKEGISGEEGLIAGVQSVENTLNTVITTSTNTLQSNNKIIAEEIENLKQESQNIGTQITTLITLKAKFTEEADKTAMQTTIDSLNSRQKEITSQIQTLTIEQKTNEAVIEGITPTENSKEQLNALNTGLDKIKSGISSLNENLENLNTAAKALPSALSELSNGTVSLVTGSKELSSGAKALNKGSKELKTGIQTLDTSTKSLTQANNQLTESASTIAEGASGLAEGIETFDREAIEKICNYINGDVKDIAERSKKLSDLANEYNNFTMLNDDNSGSVRFIMIMDAINQSENNKEEAILETNIEAGKDE